MFKVTNCDLKRRSSPRLLVGQLKKKVPGEPVFISLDRLIQDLRRDPIETGQVRVENHLVPAHLNDERLNLGRGGLKCFLLHWQRGRLVILGSIADIDARRSVIRLFMEK